MDEVGPGPAYDSSGFGRDLTFHGGASIPASGSGQTGTGLRLDGVDGYADTTATVRTDQSFTVSAWVRLADGNPATPDPDLPTGRQAAVTQQGTTVDAFFLGYQVHLGQGSWVMHMPSGDATGLAPTTAFVRASPSQVGQWVHLVGVYDATRNVVQLYVNGADGVSFHRSSAGWHGNGPFVIGAGWGQVGGVPARTGFWRGDIDEVRIYTGVVPGIGSLRWRVKP
jgi:hypothetical protein